ELDPGRLRVNIYTDRPLYRPDQTVYFKGVVRQDRDATYEVPSDLEITARVRNPNGEEIFQERVQLSPFGTFNGQIALPEDAPTGQYEIFFSYRPPGSPEGDTGERLYSGFFNVAEYRRPDFEVTVESDSGAV